MIRRKLSSFVVLFILLNGLITLGMSSIERSGSSDATAASPINYSNYDYYVENMSVFMAINPTGGIDVFEYINFTFNRGTYSMAYREIPHKGFDDMKSVSVENETGATVKIGAKYEFDWFRGKYIIRWSFTPEKGPGNTSFFITYSVTNAVKSVTKDQLGIDWNIIGEEWSVPIRRLTVMMLLPWNITGSPLFDYKPEDAKTQVWMDQTLINFTREHIKPHKPIRLVVYYPKSFDPLFNILTFMRENSFAIAAFIFLILLMACLITILYKNFAAKVPPRVLKPNPRVTKDPPKLTTLLLGSYHPLSFFSGIVHLAHMGFLRIVDESGGGDGEIWIEAREAELDELAIQLSTHDTTILNAVGEAPAKRPLADLWRSLSKDTGDTVLRDLKYERYFNKASRSKLNFTNIGAGALSSGISTALLLLLINVEFSIRGYPASFFAVALGGLFLGFILGGVAVLILGGFFMPRYTMRGCDERSQQAADLERISSELDKASKSKPNEAPIIFDSNVAALTAAPVSVKGGFPTLLRKVAAQAGDVEYYHPWYVNPDIEGGAGSMSFAAFGLAYADTLERVPYHVKGRQRPGKKGGPPGSSDDLEPFFPDDHPDKGPSKGPDTGMGRADDFTILGPPPPRKGGGKAPPSGPGQTASPRSGVGPPKGGPRTKGGSRPPPKARRPAGPGPKEGI